MLTEGMKPGQYFCIEITKKFGSIIEPMDQISSKCISLYISSTTSDEINIHSWVLFHYTS